MSNSAGILPELHQLLIQLDEVRSELDQGPKRIRGQEQILRKKQADLEILKARLTELRKLADGKSLQLKTNDSKILNLRGKLNASSTNKEYEIISSQIEADEMANSVLEDEILEALEKVDQCQREIGDANQGIEAQQKKVAETKSAVDSARQGLEDKATKLSAAIAEKEQGLPASIMDQYRRLVQAKGADSIAVIENDTCSSCYSTLTSQERVNLNMGKLMFCRTCGHLIYRLP